MDRPPPLDKELVQTFVIAAHRDLDEVKTLLEATPSLVNATQDWGGGDWETALGGAAHTNQVAILNYLLAHGARLDIFAATMLGKNLIVKAMVADDPAIVNVPGPHGISLQRHAAMAGNQEILDLIAAQQ